MHKKLCILGLTLAFQLVAPFVVGQQAPTYVARRPSETSASVNINTIGGYNTRAHFTSGLPGISDYSNTQAPQFGSGINAGSIARQYQASRSQALFNPTGSQIGLPNSPGVPPTYGRGQEGRFLSPALRNRSPVEDASDPATLQLVSGLTEAMSEYTPLTGWDHQVLEVPPAAYFPTRLGDSSFHRFFQLQPAADAAPPPSGEPLPPLSTLLGKQNDLRAKQLLGEGLQVFKRGTTPTQPERLEQLRHAQGIFDTVCRLDRENALAPLLSAHAALARDDVYQAARYLLEAINRDPQVLGHYKDLSEYYGDSRLLTDLMQLNQQVGDKSGSAEGYTLQAYVWFTLGDAGRVAQALERLRRAPVAGGEHSLQRMQLFLFAVGEAQK